MNSMTDLSNLSARSGTESLINGQCVWVELLDANNCPTAALQVSNLPLALKRLPKTPFGTGTSPSGDAVVHIVQVRPGVMAAIPAEPCKVRFNGGPPTKLPHEFESWVVVETRGARFRITNAGFATQSSDTSNDAARPSRLTACIAAATRCAKRARDPGLLALSAVVALATMALADWLAITSQTTYWTALLCQRGRLTDLLVWWACWCAVSRLLIGQFRWFAHTRIVTRAMLAYGASKLLIPPACAAAGIVFPMALRDHGWILLAAAAAWAHVAALPAKQTVRRTMWLTVGAALAIGAVSPILTLFDKNVAVPALAATLPVGIDQAHETPPERALEDVAAIQAAADRARSDPFK